MIPVQIGSHLAVCFINYLKGEYFLFHSIGNTGPKNSTRPLVIMSEIWKG